MPEEEKPEVENKEADLEERTSSFNKELAPLLAKYELGITAFVQVTPDGRLQSNAVIVSSRGLKKEEVPKKEETKLENPDE